MARTLSILVLVLMTLTAGFARAQGNACAAGDALMGPNCVHTEWLEHSGMRDPFSIVYRMKGGKKVVVWDDQGEVQKSNATRIVVLQLVLNDEGFFVPTAVQYNWSEGQYR